ncbi:energy transducer TonB [Alkalicaulis satelles]|uniref:Protein TonB n=1 Tax=Alkalicaulis satelles TaxID=2609175 RepID=A0A5M6ZPH3_9PROT|nr:energy transducer TonB [Alkalicaulis satelles]KAA5804131.1 energy transducer TonB [Alkalicaulis satelles]
MTALRPLLMTCGLLALAGCASANPFADPRDQVFRVTSDMPVPPNVERAADASGCSGGQLNAVEARLPDYPARGWSRGLQGWTVVQFDVREDGLTQGVHVARGVPGGSFNREAERAVRDWRFAPLEPGEQLTGCVVLFEFTQGLVRVR